ncbi:MAG: hypothetical protein JWO71_4352 [Candidatus Acidoferrum typicum]|nr:hypothetical protein [Candidatus Acidoferrum typicum]
MSRDQWAAIAATIAVAVVVILGFRVLGSPASQRLVQADLRTVGAIAELAQQINQKWATGARPLPADLNKLPSALKQDPVTGKPFVYHAKSNDEYELCASFATDNRNAPTVNTADPWIHPQGDYCFQFQASTQVPSIPYSY